MAAKQAVLVVVMIGVLAGAWYFALRKPAPKTATAAVKAASAVADPAPAQPPNAGEATKVATLLQNTIATERQVASFEYAPHGGKDPMAPPPKPREVAAPETVEEARHTVDVKVTGIAWDREDPLAVINEKVVRRGDSVQGATVVRIDPDLVALRLGGHEWVVRLKGESDAEQQPKEQSASAPAARQPARAREDNRGLVVR